MWSSRNPRIPEVFPNVVVLADMNHLHYDPSTTAQMLLENSVADPESLTDTLRAQLDE